MHAEDFKEVKAEQELTGLELDIYREDGNQYDRVKSAKAELDIGRLCPRAKWRLRWAFRKMRLRAGG